MTLIKRIINNLNRKNNIKFLLLNDSLNNLIFKEEQRKEKEFRKEKEDKQRKQKREEIKDIIITSSLMISIISYLYYNK